MMRVVLGLFVLLALAVSTATTAMAALATIQGTATTLERLALPEGAVLEVELLDISRADAKAERLASIRVKPEGEVPIPFTLHYDPAVIDERHSYTMAATIIHEGRMLFRSDTVHPVLMRGAGDLVDIPMVRVASDAQPAAMPALVGPDWVAEDIDRRGVIDRLQSFIAFTPEGRVQGHGGCNTFTGGYTVDGDALLIGGEGGRLAATLKACPPAVMDQDRRFLDALGRVRSWRLETDLIFLLDAEGTPILRLWQRDT